MLPQPVGLLKLMQNLFQGRNTEVDSVKKTFITNTWAYFQTLMNQFLSNLLGCLT